MIDEKELRHRFWMFEHYMTAKKWDSLDVHADEGLRSVAAFIEFVTTGDVTFDDEEE